jgi:hypothetical protein
MLRQTFGAFGDSLDQALRTEFFAWFRLTECARDELPDGSACVQFRPSGGKHRELVVCRISGTVNRGTTAMALALEGRFIDDPKLEYYARDFARSFISNGVADEDDTTETAEIIRDLNYRANQPTPRRGGRDLMADMFAALDRGEEIVVQRNNPNEQVPDLPVVASRGFAVFAGARKLFTRNLTTRFTMENTWQDDTRTLTISFQRYQ